MTTATEYKIHLRSPHSKQREIRESKAKRKIIRAGRRSGKTVIGAEICVDKFLGGLRPLYATPTSEQLETWWFEVKRALAEPIDAGIYKKNETEHTIEREGTKNRIKGKTAWNADMLRGDYSDFLVLDEFQLMNEDTWEVVGAPMLLDNDGDALFIYTPPSFHNRSVSKAKDPRHAAKMFKKAQKDKTGRWQTFQFTSLDNPYISQQALAEITQDMSNLSYRQEILAEDIEEVPGALWTRELLDKVRVVSYPIMARIVIGVDPPGGATECGIIVAGKGNDGQAYIIADYSLRASPDRWAETILTAWEYARADIVVGEANFGGDMVQNTIIQAAKARDIIIRYKNVTASRGKAVRAEPIVALYEQNRAHHVGQLPYLEEELCTWIPGETRQSPNRMDALVWALTELMLGTSWRPL